MIKITPALKNLLLTLLLVLILLAIVVGMLPFAIKWGTVYWLNRQGVEASIEQIAIDLDDAILNITNAKGHNAEGKGFTIERFHIDYAWRPLLDRTLVIENLELNGFRMDTVETTQGTLSIAGVKLDGKKKADNDVKDGTEQAKPWAVQLGHVLLSNIQYCYEFKAADKQHLCVNLDRLDWQGQMTLATNKQLQTTSATNNLLAIHNISINDKKHNDKILAYKSMQLNKLVINSVNDVRLDELLLTGIDVLRKKDVEQRSQQVVHLDSLLMNKLHLTDQQLNIQQIIVSGIGGHIVRNKQGQWEFERRFSEIRPVPDKKQQDKPTSEIAQKKTLPIRLKINELKFIDSHSIHLSDLSQKAPFDLSTEIKVFSLKHIDTGNPLQSSDIQLHIITDKHGHIELGGTVQLLAEARSFDLKGQIVGVDLRPAGAYMETGLGHRIQSGHLNADLNLQATQGQMNILLDLDLKQLKLKTLSKKQEEELDEEMGMEMPLAVALNLLRERDNSIKLKLAITGDMNKPEFNLSNAINKALTKTLTATVIYLYTPIGLVSATTGLFDRLTGVRFEPIEFDAGNVRLTSLHKERLDKMAALLIERPKLTVTICGFANGNDLGEFDPELQAEWEAGRKDFKMDVQSQKVLHKLATKRSENVKTYLIDKGIAADRLILCEPEFEAKGIAGVRISI